MPTLAALLVSLALGVPVVTGATTVPGGLRIRPHDERSTNLLAEGLRRSQTIRALVDRLERSDVIVYVQSQPMLKNRLAGTVVFVTTVSRFRYVRVSLNPAVSGNTAISVLGHELQHVLEIANEPSIVDAESLTAYYRANGIHMRAHNGWDSEAARDMGDEVRRDLTEGSPECGAECGVRSATVPSAHR